MILLFTGMRVVLSAMVAREYEQPANANNLYAAIGDK